MRVYPRELGFHLGTASSLAPMEEGDPRREKTARVLTLAERFVLAYVILWLPGSEHGTADETSFIDSPDFKLNVCV